MNKEDKLSASQKDLLSHFHKFEQSFKGNFPCFLSSFGVCNSESIRSHSISISGLKLLAEDGHLTTFELGSMWQRKPKEMFKKIGLRQASTFPGFCEKHDGGLFKELDNNDLSITPDLLAALVLRTFVQESYKKIKGGALAKSYIILGDSFEESYRKIVEEGFSLGHKDLFLQSREVYESLSHGKSSWKHIIIEFSDHLPFCFSAPVNFEVKPSFGNKDPYSLEVYESCLMALLPSKNGSKFFILFPSSQNRHVRKFLDRLGIMVGALPSRILQTALEVCENTYFKTSWITGLNTDTQKNIHSIFFADVSASELLERQQIDPLIIQIDKRVKITTNTLVAKKWKQRLR